MTPHARAGHGAPLLYLHGMLGLISFETAFSRLAVSFDVIAPLAAIVPTRVERLALVNPVGLWLDEVQGDDPFAVHPGMPSEGLFSASGLRKQFVLDGHNKVDAHVEELLNLRASAKFLWPIPDTGIRKRLGRIKAPTLIVTSELDRVVPAAYGPAWQQAIARAELTTLAGTGHVPEMEQPVQFADIIAQFLLGRRSAALA